MGILKEWMLLLCLTTVLAVRIDSGGSAKKTSVQRSPSTDDTKEERYPAAKGRENFNPGYTQHGGWHEPEGAVSILSQVGGNQWQAGDFANYNPSLESKGSSYHPESVSSVGLGQKSTFASVGADYSGISSGGPSQGGDLVVGQGSVQRPASSPNQYSPEAYNKGPGSYPVQIGIQNFGQSGPRYPQGNKQFGQGGSEYPEYVGQHSGSGGNLRPGADKPIYNQYPGQKGGPYQHDAQNVHSGQATQFSTIHSSQNHQGGKIPSYSGSVRPVQSGGSKITGHRPSPSEGHFQQGPGVPRYPGPPGGYYAGQRQGGKRPGPGFKASPSAPQPVKAVPGILQSEPGGPYYSLKADTAGPSFFSGL